MEEKIKQKALLTAGEMDKVCERWLCIKGALASDLLPLTAQAQLDKAFPIGKQIGFKMGIELAKKKGKRELINWLHEMVNCEHLFYRHKRFACPQCGCVEALKDE